jgi:hypothetical protein
MNQMSIIKQQIRDFRIALNNPQVEKVTIYCEHMKPGETNTQTWTVGIGETYSDIPCLNETLNQYNIKSLPFANIVVGKNIFFIDYNVMDLTAKKKITVTFNNGSRFIIDKATPMVKLPNGYLAWCLIEK